MSKPYQLTIADLRSTCRLLAKIEVLGDGSRNEELVVRNQAGEIVVRAKGKVTPAKVQQFRNSYRVRRHHQTTHRRGAYLVEVQLTSTSKIVTLNGIDCRVWEGVTKGGIACHAYIPRIAVQEGLDAAEFERDLTEHRKPSFEVEAIPARMVL